MQYTLQIDINLMHDIKQYRFNTESKLMVIGDDVCDGDDEEALEIPLSEVESRINLTPKVKIVDMAMLCFATRFVLSVGKVFKVY
jgi:hypothetical protein